MPVSPFITSVCCGGVVRLDFLFVWDLVVVFVFLFLNQLLLPFSCLIKLDCEEGQTLPAQLIRAQRGSRTPTTP